MLSPGALSLMERLLRTLVEAGVPSEHRIIAAGTLLSHVTGFVLQEQRASQTPAVTAETFADLRERFPYVFRETPLPSQDEKFQQSVRLPCTAFDALIKR
jgi:TetR/AcrR family tetracycline transcriptional repressor